MTVLNRRRFLSLGGAAVIAAPFCNLLTRPARAADTGGAKRLLIFFSPNGTIPHKWRPEGSGSSFSFPAGSILEPLESIRDDLLILDGLDFYSATNHEGGMAAMLTGNHSNASVTGGLSIDQYVAQELASVTKFPSLELGVQTSAWGGNIQTRMCYSGPSSFVTPDDNPSNVYMRMFGDVGASEEEKMLLKERRLSVIDLVRGEVNDLHNRLGAEERVKLDVHLDALRTSELALTADTGACDPGTPPSVSNIYDNDNFPTVAKQQMDLAVQSLACGLTNVATVQLSHTVGPTAFTWLGINDGHHTLSHIDDGNTAGVADFVATERWFAEQFSYLVEKLKGLPDPEGGGTLLDSTCVLWAKEMGDGRMHVCTGVPFVIAGSSGGFFQTGRFIDFGGVYHNRLLVSICHALGLNNNSFGDPNGGEGPLEELRA